MVHDSVICCTRWPAVSSFHVTLRGAVVRTGMPSFVMAFVLVTTQIILVHLGAQEWTISERRGSTSYVIGITEVGPGKHLVRMRGGSNYNMCFRMDTTGELTSETNVQVLTVKSPIFGCAPRRFVFSGTNAWEEVLQGQTWVRSPAVWSGPGTVLAPGQPNRPLVGLNEQSASAPVSTANGKLPPMSAPTTATKPLPLPVTVTQTTDSSADELLKGVRKQLAELQEERRQSQLTNVSRVPRLSARALVIGNGRYASFGRLKNPANDARAIAAKLQGFGIDVDLVLDAERDDLIRALNEYSVRAAGKDISILFYAGHGVQVEGTNYLIPVNMRADGVTSGYVKLAGISLNAALDYLPAKTKLVFLDACRDNAASRALVATRGGASVGLAPVQAGSGTLIAYATRDGATADDGDGRNSPYTSALLQHLDTPDDVALMLRQVRQTVLRNTSGRQEPWEYGSLVGERIVLPLMSR